MIKYKLINIPCQIMHIIYLNIRAIFIQKRVYFPFFPHPKTHAGHKTAINASKKKPKRNLSPIK